MARRERPDARKGTVGGVRAFERFPPPSVRAIGITLLVLLLTLAATGIVLAWAYVPDPAHAHDATAALAHGPLWWVRSVHAWTASAALALALLLAARAYVSGEARSSTPFRVFAGLSVLALLLLAFFTGTVLPWDQHAWEAFEHLAAGTALTSVPLAGSDQPLDAPLRALFHVHALVVPAALALALFVHRRLGRADVVTRGGLHPAVAGAVLVAAVVAAAIAWPPPLGPAPIAGLSVSRPAWPFLWLVPIQDAFGAVALFALPAAFALAACGILLGPAPGPRRRAITLGLVAGAFGLLTAFGAM